MFIRTLHDHRSIGEEGRVLITNEKVELINKFGRILFINDIHG